MLPFSYLIRNLLRRRLRTVVTVLGIAATTLLVVAMQSFADGMRDAAYGNLRHDAVYLLGTSAEVDLVRSVVPRGNAEVAAASAPGVREVEGQRAASVELHIATRNGNQIGLLRGVTPAAYLVHQQVTVVKGREPREPFEIMVGALAAARMGLSPDDVAIGKTLPLERRAFRIVGQFAAPGTIYEAELWEANEGPIEITPLQKALVEGKLNSILKLMAKGPKATSGDKLDALSNLKELGGKSR